MKEMQYYGTTELRSSKLYSIQGGIPILVVLGAVSAAVSAGKIVDQIGEWFLQGWNNPQ